MKGEFGSLVFMAENLFLVKNPNGFEKATDDFGLAPSYVSLPSLW